MRRYELTVAKLRDCLNEMIERGHGDFPVVVSTVGVGVMPIASVGAGPLIVSNGRYGRAWIETDDAKCESLKAGEFTDVAVIETPQMIPVDFWRKEVE